MTDIKISQLSTTTSLADADLFAVSKSLGASSWESKSISAANLAKVLSTSTRTLKVALDGVRDASTIQDAITLAIALVPTETSPVVIQVMPGSYSEDNPINIPEWVSIYSEGGIYTTVVTPINDGDIFVGVGNSNLEGFTIKGLAAFSNVAYKSEDSTTGMIQNCLIENCQTGILSDAGSIVANFVTGISTARVFVKFLSAVDSGFLVASSCSLTGTITQPTYAFYSSDAGSELYLFSCSVTNCINGLYATNNGYIDALTGHFDTCENAIVISATGSSHIKSTGCIIEASSGYDMQVLSSTARLSFSGGHFDSYARQIVSGATINIVADDEGMDGAKLTGESSVEGAFGIGYPGATYEDKDIILNVGDGRSYYMDQYGDTIAEYWSWNNTTSAFLPYSTYAGTQLTGDGDAIVVGSKFPFPAIRLEVTTAANVGSNSIVAEYWNGTTWVETTMCAYDRQELNREGPNPFEAVEDHYVEVSQKVLESVGEADGWDSAYNVANEIPAWSVGYALYALRFRNDGALTTGMTFRSGKVRGDGSQVSTQSSKTVRWGKFRTQKVQYIGSETFIDDAIYPPTRTDLIMSAHIAYKDMPNFGVNAISEITTAFIIPSDLDTASPLTCNFDCVALSSNTGAIATTIYTIRVDSTAASIVTGSMTEVEYTQLTNVAGVANSFATVVQDIDISEYGTNDLVLIGLRRQGTDPTDTYDGDALVGDLILKYYSKFS